MPRGLAEPSVPRTSKIENPRARRTTTGKPPRELTPAVKDKIEKQEPIERRDIFASEVAAQSDQAQSKRRQRESLYFKGPEIAAGGQMSSSKRARTDDLSSTKRVAWKPLLDGRAEFGQAQSRAFQ